MDDLLLDAPMPPPSPVPSTDVNFTPTSVTEDFVTENMSDTKPDVTPPKFSTAAVADKIGVLLGGLFVLYLIISGNYVGELFNCGMQKLFGNYAVKHLLGVLTMYFFVTLLSPGIDWHPVIIAAATLIMYVIFVISNRSEPTVQLMFIGVLAIIYLLQMGRDYKSKQIESMLAAGDKRGMDKAFKEIQMLVRTQWGLAIMALVLVVMGHMIYIGKKRIEFGGKFNYLRLFGGTKCSFKDPRYISPYEAFLRFFGIHLNVVPQDPMPPSPTAYFDKPIASHDDMSMPPPPPTHNFGSAGSADDFLDDFGDGEYE
jgi:hypothetical protein